MNGDEQTSVLNEIRNILREMAAVQKTEAAAAAEHRAWLGKKQEAHDEYYRQYLGRHKIELRFRYALVGALVAISLMWVSTNWLNVIRQGAAKLNIPEFVLPNEKPVGGNP